MLRVFKKYSQKQKEEKLLVNVGLIDSRKKWESNKNNSKNWKEQNFVTHVIIMTLLEIKVSGLRKDTLKTN